MKQHCVYDSDFYSETINQLRIQKNPHYKDIIRLFIIRQNFNCEGWGITYTDSLLIGGEFTEDMVRVGWADPNFREGCKFLRHLIQQSLHLQQKHHSQLSGFIRSLVRIISTKLTGSCLLLCSCAQSGAVEDTAPVWSDVSPRTHRKLFLSHPAETAVWQRSREWDGF